MAAAAAAERSPDEWFEYLQEQHSTSIELLTARNTVIAPVDDVEQAMEFLVVIRRTNPALEKFGIVYKVDSATQSLVVVNIKEGLCDLYNCQTRLHPPGSSLRERQVVRGDEILLVNGCRDHDQIKDCLMRSNDVFLRIRRPPPHERSSLAALE
eukprot:CAMPEP_0177298868 /NCGR_PEP_ID=MMETSP0368-20130122/3730_1 /TAXON_ID=447022 ORGANISM="Scrippsiella hangoei-like, Strain SHHI-4" /NCGR_SAMPLE_ID=MMETSP0368 /ASSEMBLY_ACC=CAM_ASM_000363 /LENGTH=153 /DNA_ID=CAMNT_0018757179 /DNA_START=57 /DNA_END=518 /DNA_ORIENTATION=-